MATPTLLQSWLEHSAEYEASGRKLAIVMAGGGNAGAVGAGMLGAMWHIGACLPNVRYIGISVGAYNILYTLIGQGYAASTIFGRFYTDNRFFSAARLLTSRPSLSTDYVVNQVLEHFIPLNYTAATSSPYHIEAVTTDVTGGPHLAPLTGMPKEHVQQALHATAAMPLIGRTHALDKLDGWDGWLVEHNLLSHLQAEGITDVVWFLNRPQMPYAELPKPVRFIWGHVIRRLTRHNPPLATLVRQRLAAGNFLQTIPHGLNIEVIQPPVLLAPNSRNPAHIFHALGTSYRAMGTYLGHSHLPYPAEWQPWQHHMPT